MSAVDGQLYIHVYSSGHPITIVLVYRVTFSDVILKDVVVHVCNTCTYSVDDNICSELTHIS